jgi:kumamolisin
MSCLLAFTLLFADSGQARADDGPAAAQSPRLAIPLAQTPLEVLDGRATLVSHYDPTRMLRLAIVLTPRHQAEEQQLLLDVQDKQSPLFHQFLSPEELTERFGPSADDEQAVVDWAVAQGLTITWRYPNRLIVDVEAPAGAIEQAFHLTVNNYRIPAGNGLQERTAFSNDRDPVLPSRLADVVESVQGLNSIEMARPDGGSGRLVPQPDYVAGPVVRELDGAQRDAAAHEGQDATDGSHPAPEVTPPPSGFWQPTDMYSSAAYDYGALMNQGHCCNPLGNPGSSPPQSSIAIAAFGDVSLNDVAGFQSEFNYLAYNVQKVGIDGGYTCGAHDDNCLETTLDTEWSLAMANSRGSEATTARVWVYEGANTNNVTTLDEFNQMLTDGHARAMSTSWGFPEAGGSSFMVASGHIYSNMALAGWTLVAASGDQGATSTCGDALGIERPASDPNIVAAGGTTLNEGAGATYEVAWTGNTTKGSCDGNGGGSTGGFSDFWTVPGFQTGLKFKMRATPDMSLETTYGHDVYFNGAWHFEGGTSVAAPMIAGFFAQENAYLLAIGDKCGAKGTAACAPMGNALFPMYEEGISKNAAHSPYYDILSGCNSNDVTLEFNLKPYCATPGFDEVTGWGSANMLQLAWAINWEVTKANGSPTVTYVGPATNKWYATNETVAWRVNDNAGPGLPASVGTGIAGFTEGWDSIPADPVSEPHGGSGNSFYSGPQLPNAVTGCLTFVANGCAGDKGTVSQGCHTVHVRGWNNQGWTTGDTTYGPLCYDNIPPVTTVTFGTPASNGSVKVTLTAADPGTSNHTGSGVSRTYFSLDNASCTVAALVNCTVYSSPFALGAVGTHTMRYFSEDVAGNFEVEKSSSITIK